MTSQVLVTTVPFAQRDRYPIDVLDSLRVKYSINNRGRRLREDELIEMVQHVEVLIAGTEPITARVMDAAPQLELIARVGVGLDNVDLHAARQRGITVTYTPEAPAPAVAELTISHMLSLLRHTHEANLAMRRGEWRRHMGRRISEVSVGVIGVGRIGSRVIHHLKQLGSPRIFVNDLEAKGSLLPDLNLEWVDKDTIYEEADVISLHLPLTRQTNNMITTNHLSRMHPDALLVNTSRGGIVNEGDLFTTLQEGHLGGVAIDVFMDEPYIGPLSTVARCLLTCHMGSMSEDCRMQMEVEATEEAARHIQGLPLECVVPESEYQIQNGSRD